MADIKGKDNSPTHKLTGPDEAYEVDIFNVGGKNRMAVDANISSINVPLGKDPLPDMYFNVLEAGAIGDTIRIQIAATSIDPTTPDRDLPALDYTYTLTAADVGDELALASNFADGFNDDPQADASYLEAEFVNDLRSVVHISSTLFSLNGEAVERPNAFDVTVTTTGTTVILQDSTNDRLVSRPKEVSLARDPNNPHRLGVQNVSGTVRIRGGDVDQILKEYLSEVGNPSNIDMAVNGGGVPVEFRISSNQTGGADKFVEALKFIVTDGNIKVNNGNFLGLNSALTNGILVEFYKDGILTYAEPLIKNTNDILGQWSSTTADNQIIGQSGGDYLESNYNLISENIQFTLEAGKDDYIRVLIQDALQSIDTMKMLAKGFLED
jgi:hypothetical protein